MQSTKRQAQKENTRNKIMQTAYRVYAEYGFAATTSAIAKEAGVSHGTIFVHFATLEDLLTSLLSDFGGVVGMRVHDLAKNGNSVGELLEAHLDVLAEYEQFYIRLITQTSLLPEEARNTFVTIQSIVALHFSKAVERGIEDGRIKKDIPPHMLFNTWIGLVHYYLQNKAFFAPEESVIARYRSQLIKSFLELIKI